jgi:hypothetical protein
MPNDTYCYGLFSLFYLALNVTFEPSITANMYRLSLTLNAAHVKSTESLLTHTVILESEYKEIAEE